MTTETILQRAGEVLAPFSKGNSTPETNRLDVQIEASDLPAATAVILSNNLGYLSAITPTDLG